MTQVPKRADEGEMNTNAHEHVDLTESSLYIDIMHILASGEQPTGRTRVATTSLRTSQDAQAILKYIAQRDAAIKGRLMEALPEKVDVKLAIMASGPQSLGHGYAAGFNKAIEDCSAAIEREFGNR